jgi:hypothetical protein
MPDGKRKRRHSGNVAKRRWYALHRARRFRRRFWLHPHHTGHMFGELSPRAFSLPAIA